MKDIKILLENKSGSLALMGKTLGKHNISLEGGGVFDNKIFSIAHFLFDEAYRAKVELENLFKLIRDSLQNQELFHHPYLLILSSRYYMVVVNHYFFNFLG